MDLPVAERFAKAFEAKYPGVAVRVERSGAERVFQRIGQEHASNIRVVDIVQYRRRGTLRRLEEDGWLAPYRARKGREVFPERASRS